MPQIPLYNKGLGPKVEMAVGDTAPKLSSQVFEAAAQAPFEQAASGLENLAKMATQFEIREQEAELATAETDLKVKAAEAASAFVYENQDSNFRNYRQNAQSFRENWLQNNVDAYEGLNKRQRAALRNSINNRLFIDLQPGEENAFRRGQANRAETYNEAASQLVQRMAANQDDPIMLNSLMSEANQLVDSAVNQSLPVNFDIRSIELDVEKEVLTDKSLSDDVTVDDLREEREAILGGDGKYAKYNLQERGSLAATLTESINRLENEDVAGALSQVDNSRSSIRMATNFVERSQALASGLESLTALRKAGQFQLATQIERELRALSNSFNVLQESAFMGKASARELLRSYRVAAEEAGGTPDAAQAEANYLSIRTILQERDAAIAADPAGYVSNTFMQREGRLPTRSELVSLQQTIGVESYKISPFTSDEFTALQEDLKALDAPGQFEALRTFFAPLDEAGFGDMGMRKAREFGLTDVQMLAAASINASPQIRNLARDLLNAERIFTEDPTAFNKLLSKDDKDDLTKAVGTAMGDFSKTVIGGVSDYGLGQQATGDRINAMISMQDAVTKLATVYMHFDGKSATEAATIASGIVNERYEITGDRPGLSERGKIRIPTSVLSAPNQPNFMRQILGKYINADYLASQVVTKKHSDGSDYSSVEMNTYVNEILLSGTWITAEDDSGVYLVDRSGMPVLVKQSADGRMGEFRLEINYQDLAEQALAIQMFEEETGIIGGQFGLDAAGPLDSIYPPRVPMTSAELLSLIESFEPKPKELVR